TSDKLFKTIDALKWSFASVMEYRDGVFSFFRIYLIRKAVNDCVQEGVRARQFNATIEWLISAGMLNRIYKE
ncbi:MAG: hypothetical protein RSA97_03935, partial [Oscillospiraceae bacterium]